MGQGRRSLRSSGPSMGYLFHVLHVGRGRPGTAGARWAVDLDRHPRGLLVAHREGLPWLVERLDLASGQRTPAATIRAHDPAGLRLSVFGISRDAKYYVHT